MQHCTYPAVVIPTAGATSPNVSPSHSGEIKAFTHDPYSCVGWAAAEWVPIPASEAKEYLLEKDDADERLGAWVRGHAITNVVAGSPAERAGLVVGMKILEINGEETNAAVASSTIRKVWAESDSIVLKLESTHGVARSKRSLAKARARIRSKNAKAAHARRRREEAQQNDADTTSFDTTSDVDSNASSTSS